MEERFSYVFDRGLDLKVMIVEGYARLDEAQARETSFVALLRAVDGLALIVDGALEEVDMSQLEDAERIAERSILLNESEEVGHKGRTQARFVRSDRVEKLKGRAGVKSELVRPLIVRPAVVVDFEESVRDGENTSRAVFESNIFVDVERTDRGGWKNRLDIVEAEDARHFFDDILFDRNVLFASEGGNADAQRSVFEEFRFKLDRAKDFERFFLREVDAHEFVHSSGWKFDVSCFVVKIPGE